MPTFTVFKGSKDGSIKKTQITKPDLQGDQVFLKVTASGLCGTDLHYRSTDMALGHEGIGVVEETGPLVNHLKRGDRVGWGYNHDADGVCLECLEGRDTYCPNRKFYGEADLDQGSFATHAVWREAFLFRVPENIPDDLAAPLLCGGATVFNAIYGNGVEPEQTVGVIGVGGLGHLAIEFASKMGCEVIVFSGTDSKKEEAQKLGAKEFHATKGAKEIKTDKKVDHLIVTTSFMPEWSLFLPILAPRATIYPLTVAEGDFSIPHMPMILNGTRIQGTVVAPRNVMVKMFDFASRNNVRPMINKFPMTEQGITEAMEALNEGKMRYRGVLVP
ncbi:MAG: hypothetical protein Q9227_005104 [Pyrenula ochraceoflavens]